MPTSLCILRRNQEKKGNMNFYNFVVGALLILSVAVTAQSNGPNCQPGWFLMGGRCIRIFSGIESRLSWDGARQSCQSQTGGGDLVELFDAQENMVLAEQLPKGERYFIGASDRQNEGIWTSSTGGDLKFSAFDAGEPNGGEKTNCAELRHNGTWNDICCRYKANYICQQDTLPPVATDCHPQNQFKGKCYVLVQNKAKWTTARENCIHLNGKLAQIDDKETNNFIFELIKNTKTTWLGGNDRETEGTFKWDGGRELIETPLSTYTNWFDKEPDNQRYGPGITANCMAMSSTSGQWFDVACIGFGPYVCEINLTSRPKTVVDNKKF